MPEYTPGLVANYAVRILLERVGQAHDRKRGLPSFLKDANARAKVIEYFGGLCPYCNVPLAATKSNRDHLIPINQTAGGLHCWGNVVWVCEKCNGDKGENEWVGYVRSISINEEQAESRIAKVEAFRQHYGYEVSDAMRSVAQSLHRGVTTLINEKVRIAETLTA